MSRVRLSVAALALSATLLALPGASSAYVPQTVDFVNGAAVTTRWAAGSFPLVFDVTPGLTDDIGGGADRAALERAMSTWSSVPGSLVAMAIGRERAVEADVFDGINVIEFSNDSSLQGAGFVALSFLSTRADGTIIEADMLVNDRGIGFTDDPQARVGIDLETAMLRELGRVLGLASSPLGARNNDGTVDELSAIMYPVARGVGESARVLSPDDAAGIAALYPAAGSGLGAISGQVRRGANGVFGAHVVAFDPLQQIMVGAVSLPDGSFRIGGLPAGRYLLEVLPLRTPVTPASLGGIFDSTLVDTGFRRAFLSRTVRLGSGASVGGVTLEVQ